MNPLMWLMAGSVPAGTWFGIRVRIHASMILYVAFSLLAPGALGGWHNTLTSIVILFGIVLLHEFGHCLGSWLVGGRPDEILIYPLGGLAYAGSPHRPWPRFVTVLFGPLVNVVICAIAAVWLIALAHNARVVPWDLMNVELRQLAWRSAAAYYLWWVFATSWALLLFNLLPIFPLDGGQMLHAVLWAKLGYYRATIFATVVGMIAAGLFFVYGLTHRSILLMVLAVMGFITCANLYREVKANGPWAYQDDEDYGFGGLYGGAGTATARKLNARKIRKAQRLEREAAAEQEQIDAILAKVSAQGMQSLTWWEKRALRKATERQRKRDAELTR
jgi:Zn-dependent protease